MHVTDVQFFQKRFFGMVELTDSNVRTLPVKGSDTLYPDDGCENFYLRVRKAGSRTYCIQWRQGHSQRRATIGKASHLTLDEARQRARKLLVGIGDGIDPIATKAKPASTISNCLASWRPNISTSAPGTCGRPVSGCAGCTCRPTSRRCTSSPVAKINRAMIANELRTIARDRGPVAANRGRSTLSAFFGWLIGEGLLEANPVIGTNKSSESAGRERVLTDAELVAIWNARRPATTAGSSSF